MNPPRLPRQTLLTPLQVAYSLLLGLVLAVVVAGLVFWWAGRWA